MKADSRQVLSIGGDRFKDERVQLSGSPPPSSPAPFGCSMYAAAQTGEPGKLAAQQSKSRGSKGTFQRSRR
jgi:hypothetical protein